MSANEPNSEYDIVEPKADSLIHSIRSFGYDLSTALADLIDNSITARAKNIWVNFQWDGAASWISILDDGIGMTQEELVKAMTLGSKNPLLPRPANDLGRFGLGLKTATFSQCKRLTVGTKVKDGKIAVRCWDLDYVSDCGQWRLLKKGSDSLGFNSIGDLNQGTIVLWDKLDRVIDEEISDNRAHDHFLERAARVKKHLAMVFHRFLEGPNPLKIWFNGRPVTPWNPFLINQQATELLTVEPLFINGKRIEVRPYILPHHSKISQEDHIIGAGTKGWNDHQGFYVYRNKRMLVAGDWLGLGFPKEEHFKLARIQIDIPNSLDQEWLIDVKKSKARPPQNIRQDLKRIAKLTRDRASNIYRHRGKVVSRISSTEFVYLWQQSVKHGKISYKINREHPLIRECVSTQNDTKALDSLLKMLEETIPIPMILLNYSEQSDNIKGPFEDEPPKELIAVLEDSIKALSNQGLATLEIKKRLLAMEPFDLYKEQVVACCEKLEEGRK
ncbi:ATP-binding protein [uncultured Brevibacillus sp.]|uniref:ATP-binding protein n=1 Tax=uncultured Brevibacillus sp. TaxID=169970 RepID=UPI0025993A01|nr:ATP-binding protein [uncultured Brevibacillus sp.]